MLQSFNPNELYKVTAIGRIIDPIRYPTNRLIMLMTVVAGVVAGLVTLINRGDLGAAIAAGVYTGGAVFLAWAISRDIDPDNDYSAFVSAFVALLMVPSPLALISLGFLLVLLRVVSRIVGPTPGPIEYLLTIVLLAIAVLVDGKLIAFGGAVGFVMDARLSGRMRYSLIAAAAAVVMVIISFVVRPPTLALPPTLFLASGIVILAAFIAVMATSRRLHTPCDAPGFTLDPQRIQAAMLVVALTGALTLADGEAMIGFWPMWSAMVGVVVWRVILLAVPSFRRSAV